MIKRAPLPSCLRSIGWRTLPEVGQRVKIVVRSGMELWQGSKRVRFKAGESYVGTTAAVSDDGLIDLVTSCGLQMRFYAHDTAFALHVVS